jgi:hypothetical protein
MCIWLENYLPEFGYSVLLDKMREDNLGKNISSMLYVCVCDTILSIERSFRTRHSEYLLHIEVDVPIFSLKDQRQILHSLLKVR